MKHFVPYCRLIRFNAFSKSKKIKEMYGWCGMSGLDGTEVAFGVVTHLSVCAA